jgi:hypothetical protein
MKASSITDTTGVSQVDSQRWRTCPNTVWVISSVSTPRMAMPMTELARRFGPTSHPNCRGRLCHPWHLSRETQEIMQAGMSPSPPRLELIHFIERLAGITLVRFQDGKLLMTNLGGWNETFLPVAGRQFRYVPKKEPAEPVATLALLTANDEGRFIQAGTIEAGTMTTMKRIPAWLAILEIALTAFTLLSLVSILIYAPFWILGGLSKKRRRPAERGMRIWPLMAVLSLIVSVGMFILFADVFRLGNLTAWSGAVFVATAAFAVEAVASAVALWRAPAQAVRRGVRRHSIVVTAALLIATAYLAYWGIIGLRTWG